MTRYEKQLFAKGTKVKLIASRTILNEIGINGYISDIYIVDRKMPIGTDYWYKKYPKANWYLIKRQDHSYPLYEIPSFMLEVYND